MPGTINVTVSYAQSIDGRIATKSGDSRWISQSASLKLAHRLRKEHDVILVGIGTVLRDDPKLTCRINGGRNPVRAVCDTNLQIPDTSYIVQTAGQIRTIVFTSVPVPNSFPEEPNTTAASEKVDRLIKAGVDVVSCSRDEEDRVNLKDVLDLLRQRGYTSVFVEGGGKIITSFLRRSLVDRMIIVTAPLLIGHGVPAVGDLGVNALGDAVRPRSVRIRRMGKELAWHLAMK